MSDITAKASNGVGWYTRALASINPQAAQRRLASRIQFEHMARSYAAARPVQGGKRTDAKGTAANVEIGQDLARVRNIARKLVRDNPHASSAISKSAAHIVGTGIFARANAPKVWKGVILTPEERAYIQVIANAAFDRFADNCDPMSGGDWYGQQNLAARAFRESGEGLVRWLPRGNLPDQIVQILEGDFLDDRVMSGRYTGVANLQSGHTAISGVEFDAETARIAFHMFANHPGDYNATGLQSTRVDAKNIDHIYQPLRPGQVRGISAFAPVAMKLGLLGDLSEYGAQAAVMQSLVGMVIKVDDAADPSARPLGPENPDENGQRQAQLKPGFVWTGNPGESIEAFTPGGLGVQLVSQMEFELTAVAAGLDMPRHVITGDVSKANYSSLRASKLDYDAMLAVWQWLVMIPRMIAPAWRRQMAIAALTLPDGADSRLSEIIAQCGAVYTPPLSPNVDPLKDVTAQIAEIRAGLTSFPDALGSRGTTLEDQLAEIERANAAIDAAGLILDTDPRRTGGGGSIQPAQILSLPTGS
jgi:lambda family phage portal protein